jgi:hypothetical protein
MTKLKTNALFRRATALACALVSVTCLCLLLMSTTITNVSSLLRLTLSFNVVSYTLIALWLWYMAVENPKSALGAYIKKHPRQVYGVGATAAITALVLVIVTHLHTWAIP